MKHIKSKKLVLSALALLFLSGIATANELDPLNQDELVQATRIALPTQAHAARAVGKKTAVAALPAVELLLVERRPTEKDQPGQRLADVYSYDYQSDETVHSIVDLKTQNPVSTERVQNLQLPLTENELAYASQLIFTDPEQMAPLQAEFKRITGQVLTKPEQLQVKAFVFTAETLPEGLNAASQQCGLHRCAQILLYTHDSVVFEISPIVNLSAGLVTQSIGF